jgi:hypothetical protein
VKRPRLVVCGGGRGGREGEIESTCAREMFTAGQSAGASCVSKRHSFTCTQVCKSELALPGSERAPLNNRPSRGRIKSEGRKLKINFFSRRFKNGIRRSKKEGEGEDVCFGLANVEDSCLT